MRRRHHGFLRLIGTELWLLTKGLAWITVWVLVWSFEIYVTSPVRAARTTTSLFRGHR